MIRKGDEEKILQQYEKNAFGEMYTVQLSQTEKEDWIKNTRFTPPE